MKKYTLSDIKSTIRGGEYNTHARRFVNMLIQGGVKQNDFEMDVMKRLLLGKWTNTYHKTDSNQEGIIKYVSKWYSIYEVKTSNNLSCKRL